MPLGLTLLIFAACGTPPVVSEPRPCPEDAMGQLFAEHLPDADAKTATGGMFSAKPGEVRTCRFDAEGRLMAMSSTRDEVTEAAHVTRDSQGRPIRLDGQSRYGPMSMAFTYAPHGQMASMTTDKNGDGKVDAKMDWLYDGTRHIGVESDFDGDGAWEGRTSLDEQGRIRLIERKQPNGKIEKARVTGYDENGQPSGFEVVE